MANFTSFDQNTWNSIEQRYPPLTIGVLNAVQALANDKHETLTNAHVQVTGEEPYLAIRQDLVDMGVVNGVKTRKSKAGVKPGAKTSAKTSAKPNVLPKGKKGKGMTKEEIIRQNTLEKTKQFFVDFIKIVKSQRHGEKNYTYAFNAQYAEMRLVAFMCLVKDYIALKDPKQKEIYCYELIIGIAKTLVNIRSLPNISITACDDLQQLHEKLIADCKFMFETMFQKYPRLCLSTKYDNVFPTMSIKPYASQVQLVDAIKKNPELLLIYKAMAGSGKTSSIAAIVKIIQNIRIDKKANAQACNTELLCVCSIEAVRREMCRIIWNMGIPFGIAITEDHGVRIINNFNCSSDSERLMVVADINTAYTLLKNANEHGKKKEYVLFFDEPTVGSDTPNNPITKAVCKVLAVSPAITILSSATLPDPEKIPNIISQYLSKHPSGVVKTVFSRESLIGCQMINFDGTTIVPFSHCTTVSDLQFVIKQLNTKPFIDRMLPAPVVYKLKSLMQNMGVQNCVDLETYFSDVTRLCQSQIQMVGIQLLQQLVDLNNDELIKQVCSSNFSNGERIVSSYDINKIFTTDAYKFIGPTLIVATDPIQFAKDNSTELFTGIKPVDTIVKEYHAKLLEHKKQLGKFDTIKNEDERSQRKQAVSDSSPTIDFPDDCRVNTIEHIAMYAPHAVNNIDRSLLQPYISLEHIPLDMNVDDDILRLLFAGIGIYSDHNPKLTQKYKNTILEMVASGQLDSLVVDESFCYGANYPFVRVVFIEDKNPEIEDVMQNHSMNTFFQTAARAGRVGKSWAAFSHVGNNMTQRIMNYIRGVDEDTVFDEANNLVDMFDKALADIELQDELAIKQKQRRTPLTSSETSSSSVKIIYAGNIVDTVKIGDVTKLASSPDKISSVSSSASISTKPASSYIPPHLRGGSRPTSSSSSSSSSSTSSRPNYSSRR
jgi:hypothetical protein